MSSPTKTRMAVAPMVMNTASYGEGPLFGSTPICQRVAVLKKRAWSGMLPRKICGGGSSFSSATPTAQRNSQSPANMPTDSTAQPNRASAWRAPGESPMPPEIGRGTDATPATLLRIAGLRPTCT